MKKILKYLGVMSIVGVALLLFPDFCSADALLDKVGQQSGAPQTDLVTLVANIIKIVLSILGVIFVVLIIISGVKWMTSDGDKGVKEAKTTIMNAVIGLVIIVSSWAITSFVVSSIKDGIGE
jgi:heme/copper-type cytochrome/quinol oxidase subunit 2